MSLVPSEIPDVGATSQRLRQNPKFDPLKAGFGTEEYFVWSRFDGATTVKDLILMTGLAVDRAVAIVRQLRRTGAILMPGETAPPAEPLVATEPARTQTVPMRRLTPAGSAVPIATPAAGSAPTSAPTSSTATGPQRVAGRATTQSLPTQSRTTTQSLPTAPRTGTGTGTTQTVPVQVWGAATDAPTARAVKAAMPLPELTDATAEERAMHAEPGELSIDEKARVLAGLRLVAAQDPWALVGVPPGADKRVIKRAFFERSKLFHPDRFFGRKLGAWQVRINTVFEAISSAHADLLDPQAPAADDSAATAPQSPTEYAAELFDRACVAEMASDLQAAVKLFAAAVKLDPLARYLRRAATCALAAGELQAALDHARKATALDPLDPSTARTLARVLRALDKLDEAEEVLVMALALKIDNDNLASELRADLATVRAVLARR